MLDNKHSVSPEIGEIAANGEGEGSDEGESGGGEEEENKESDNDDIEEGQDSIGLSKPCMPSIAEVDIHNRTHIPFRNWCEICVRGRGPDMLQKLRERGYWSTDSCN